MNAYTQSKYTAQGTPSSATGETPVLTEHFLSRARTFNLSKLTQDELSEEIKTTAAFRESGDNPSYGLERTCLAETAKIILLAEGGGKALTLEDLVSSMPGMKQSSLSGDEEQYAGKEWGQ